MSDQEDHASEGHQQGDGADLSVTEARAGVRRGLSKVLIISTALTVIALAVVWAVAHSWNHFV